MLDDDPKSNDAKSSDGCANLIRETRDSRVRIRLKLDGKGRAQLATGISYFNHVLAKFAHNSGFDLDLAYESQTPANQLHVVEDTGMTLGHAVHKAVRSSGTIARYGFFILPVDEVLTRVAIDFSTRPYLHFEVPWHTQLGPMTYDFHLTKEFFQAFVRTAGVTLHVDVLTPGNNHHMCESIFRAFGRATRAAVSTQGGIESDLVEETFEDMVL